MEMPDGNFYNIQIEDCPENVYFDSFGNAHHTGTWVTDKCTKWRLGYVREDIVQSLHRETEELQAKLDKAIDALRFYAGHDTYAPTVIKVGNHLSDCGDSLFDDDDFGNRARTTIEEIG